MSELAEIQRVLAEVMRRPTSLVDDAGDASCAEAIAAGNARLSPVEQVDVYREQFFLRHVDALREDFVSIEHAIGEEAFERLARAYLAAHPPSSFTLRDLGHAMARFLEAERPWADDPFLAELARVEWAFVEAFDAADAPPLDMAAVASVPEDAWPGARLVLHPAVQRLHLAWPSADYRIAVKKDEHPDRPAPRENHLVVYRGEETLCFLEIDAPAFALLSELASGIPLGEACERAASSSGVAPTEFEAKLGAWFQEWTRYGWVSSVELAAEVRSP